MNFKYQNDIFDKVSLTNYNISILSLYLDRMRR